MENDILHGWHDFFVAQAGASSALAGLLFVAVSINLTRILEFPHLPVRALEALAALLSVLVVSSWALVPGQVYWAYGAEIGGTGLAAWAAQTLALRQTRKSGYERWLRVLLNQAPPLPFVVSGALLFVGWPSGVYWIVPGVLLSILAGVYCAWILLVEIQR
jgi:hypothetical protein